MKSQFVVFICIATAGIRSNVPAVATMRGYVYNSTVIENGKRTFYQGCMFLFRLKKCIKVQLFVGKSVAKLNYSLEKM